MKTSRQRASIVLSLGLLLAAPGCCTLAHRAHTGRDGQTKAPACDRSSAGACPWLVGDALLLIPGVIPGVIAFAIDGSNGEWNHG